MNLQENCFLAVYADLASGSLAELTTNSLSLVVSEDEKLLDLSKYIFLFTMHQSSSSYSQCKLKSMKVQVLWASQVFSLLLTWSNKHFAVSSDGKEEEGQKSWGLSLSCLLTQWLSKDRPLLPKYFIKWKLSTNFLLLPLLWCQFDYGRSHWALYWALNFRSAP